MTDWTTLTDAELEAAYLAMNAEYTRRHALATIPDQVADLNRQMLSAEGITEGEPWRQPTGAHDAYPQGWTVTHDGRTWMSLMDGNVWEPGVSGWREVVEEGQGYPGYVQPTGGHDAYQTGDRVSWEGACYESNRDGNVWSPTDLPSAWDEIPCTPEPEPTPLPEGV